MDKAVPETMKKATKFGMNLNLSSYHLVKVNLLRFEEKR